MNMYRIKDQLDQYNEYICLNCKGEFTSCDIKGEAWKFCPLCATQWEGCFTKRRNKYEQQKYDWRNPGYQSENSIIIQSDEKRLMIEKGRVAGFYAVNCEPTVIWNLYSHTTTGWYGKTSAFVNMWLRWKDTIKPSKYNTSNFFRLVLVDGNKRTILLTAKPS